MKHRITLALSSLAALSACSEERSAPTGTPARIAVAPLSLPGIGDACYNLYVYNEASPAQLVGQQTQVCASRYGNGPGGDITYIGTCDAQADADADNVAENSVDLELAGVYASAWTSGAQDIGEYQNPCPPGTPCRLTLPCVENQDTLVEFNLTIMRDAKQGFFDVAVNFEDIFCSAKLDCVEALLHDGDVRSTTAVMAFACTAGEGQPTTMYLSDVSALDQVIDEHPKPLVRRRTEGLDGSHDVIETVHRLDYQTQVSQVIPPHVLQQFGVVAAFHPDAARLGRLCPSRGRRNRPRVGQLRSRGLYDGPGEGHRLAVDQESGFFPGEMALLLLAVAQRHRIVGELDDVTEKPR